MILKNKNNFKKNVISESVFAREIEMCQKLSKGKVCHWGKCDSCGVIPLLVKLHKGILIEDKEELEKVKGEIFNKK